MLFITEYLIPFIFGTIIGSFLNVCIFRIPKSESIIFPSSYCPNCDQPIGFYDNIPIVSFLVLGGKCRRCRNSISARYFFVECIAGLFSLTLFLKFGLSLNYFVYLAFCYALLVITFIDLDHQIIPDVISLPGIVVGVALSFLLPDITFLDSLAGSVAGGGALLCIAVLYSLLTKREGMGAGDIKLLAMIGAFLGLKAVIMTAFLGSFIGSIIGITVMLKEKRDSRYEIPFGPFLAIGAFISLFWGNTIMEYYLYGVRF
ncbi:MAG: prepilin peptidase [Thermodesulfobacteriota bacterium]|nr:prepilin peptidase [Thermodesulfobacteriota bacterium]